MARRKAVKYRIVCCFAMMTWSVPLTCGPHAEDATTEVDINLSSDETMLLKRIYNNDSFIRGLTKSQKALAVLNSALASVSPGPIKLALQWNDTALKGWAVANKNLDKIQQIASCSDLQIPIIDGSPNSTFFEKLRSLRGCTRFLGCS